MHWPKIFGVATVVACSICAAPRAAADEFQDVDRLYQEGRRADALEGVEGLLRVHPRDARFRFLKGLILTEQGKSKEAIAVFTSLTQDFPELPEPYNNLAVLYAAQGDYDQARAALEMAIRTHPSYAIAHENLGDIYAALASRAYDKALQLDSASQTARTKLALIRELAPPRSQATAKPAPAAKPSAPARAAASPAEPKDDTQAVLRMVEDWTAAWSSADAARYLAFYAPDFRIPGGKPRADWEAERRERLAKAKKLSVTADAPQVSFPDPMHANVTFLQVYRSESLTTSSRKSLLLVKQGDRWRIQQESVDQ
jgi:Flp pilus assembly protein TadD